MITYARLFIYINIFFFILKFNFWRTSGKIVEHYSWAKRFLLVYKSESDDSFLGGKKLSRLIGFGRGTFSPHK